jgi:hypothetical protein
MNQVKTSGIFVLFWLLLVASGVDYFNKANNTPAKTILFSGKSRSQATDAQITVSKSHARTSSGTIVRQAKTTTRKALDKSALPNEFTIPFELLYLDDQPMEPEPIPEADEALRQDAPLPDEALQQSEEEPLPPGGAETRLPNADTIPPELLALDHPKNSS